MFYWVFSGLLAPIMILSFTSVLSAEADTIFDRDQDGFFTSHLPVRGANWKGVDCDDRDIGSYPGQPSDLSTERDTNCNGIWGEMATDEQKENGGEKRQSREDFFCGDSKAMGTVVFGDSIGAGFEIPIDKTLRVRGLPIPQQTRSVGKYKKFDRFNKPQLSYITGFHPEVGQRSIYMEMVNRNQCNRNDYQNMSQIGATSFDFVDHVRALGRRPQDKPILGFVAYVGNDVCFDNLQQMTTPMEYRRNILQGLERLDATVAVGSKIILLGLVAGQHLWDIMHDRMHPLGITYAAFYNYLAVAGNNPCRTWLNPRGYVRERTTARAKELNEALKTIAQQGQWQNLDVIYMSFGLEEIMERVERSGEPLHRLIQSADGFHPRLSFHRLLSDHLWQQLINQFPHFVGPINPFNPNIQAWRQKTINGLLK